MLYIFVQYVFLTEIDASMKKGVHDELARLLVQYLKHSSSEEGYIPIMLEVRERRKEEKGRGLSQTPPLFAYIHLRFVVRTCAKLSIDRCV